MAGGADGCGCRRASSRWSRLSEDVLRVRLRPEAPFEYRAGQYVTLLRADGLARSYSLASLPREGRWSCTCACSRAERMSGWLRRRPGRETRCGSRGPRASASTCPGRPEQPLLLAGTGTGLAPLYGIVRDALDAGPHRAPSGSSTGPGTPRGLYLVEELRELAARHPNLHYRPCVLEGPAPGRA